MKADTKLRPITFGPSKTNEANEIFYNLTLDQKCELLEKFSDVSAKGFKKERAIVNYIEDNIELFK